MVETDVLEVISRRFLQLLSTFCKLALGEKLLQENYKKKNPRGLFTMTKNIVLAKVYKEH